MSGFNTKERNNNGEYEITFYTESRQDFEKVQDLCRELIDHNKPVSIKGDLIKAFELLKAHCKNRECNKDCVFYRELRAGNNIEQFCGLCEIVTSDDKENEE